MKIKQIVINIVLPIVVLVGAVLVIRYLAATRPETKSMKPPDMGQFVTVEVAKPYSEATHVKTVGRVKPAKEVVLSPEVSGRIIATHPNLIPGGFIKADEVAFEIDARPYKLAVAQQQANVARARVDLQIEGGRKVVAEREWGLLEAEIESSPTGKSLALREPQKRLAEVSVAAAASALDRARLDVERTIIKVPFNAMVKTESVELGLLATPQAALVSLVGTDTFWVEVTLPIGEVTRLAIPGINGVAQEQGALATILQKNAAVSRRGRVIKLLSELDPLGAQARIIIEVEDPLGLAAEDRGLPLFLNSFVDVELDGTAFDSVVAIPRKALRDGDSIWVLSPEGKLEIRDITVVWRERELVLATAGVAPGDQVITSRLSAPVAGMPLKVAGAAATAQGGPPGVPAPGSTAPGAPPADAPKPVPQVVQP